MNYKLKTKQFCTFLDRNEPVFLFLYPTLADNSGNIYRRDMYSKYKVSDMSNNVSLCLEKSGMKNLNVNVKTTTTYAWRRKEK